MFLLAFHSSDEYIWQWAKVIFEEIEKILLLKEKHIVAPNGESNDGDLPYWLSKLKYYEQNRMGNGKSMLDGKW